MGESNSIINIGELAKPATVLIERISDAVGGIFRPYQIARVARAEAEATLVKAETDVKVTELQRGALMRFLSEEATKQENMERITDKAIPQLTDGSKPQDVERDWIANFFDKCRIVSDEQMQQLWATILAGEANSPGTYSKRTVDFVATLDKTDATLFAALSGFGWIIGDICPLIYEPESPIYGAKGVDFAVLSHLDDIGLISFEALGGFVRKNFPQRVIIHYFGEPLLLEFKKQADNQLNVGHVMLTKTGQQLARISGARPVEGFVEYVLERWIGQGVAVASPMRGAASRA